jgi:signal transduction histidine kinase
VEDHQARVWVRDQGPGLTPEERRRLFERFVRPASVRHYGGFGLGLWIVRQIAEEHGGRVEVSSEPGAGSRFSFVLPFEP